MANILIVEDEVIIALDIKRAIKSISDNTVVIATDYETAMDYITQYPIDLVFMDINLGNGCDGIEIAAQIKAFKNIHVIYVTAYNDPNTIKRITDTKASEHLTKPFRRDDIRNMLKHIK